MIYEPENFIIMKLDEEYKVLGGWVGSYDQPDKWRLNSGISSFTKEKNGICLFYGYSGSVYKVNEKREGLSSIMFRVHDELLTLGFIDVLLKDFELEFKPQLH
jgi:hypothetical protein